MVQVIPQEPSLAALLGTGLGAGVNTGMQQMLQQSQQKKSGAALAQILGKPELAEQLGSIPMELQKQFMTQVGKAPEQPKLSSATQQYIKDIDKSAPAAESLVSAGSRLMELSDKMGGVRGQAAAITPGAIKSPDIAEFESTVLDLISFYKAMFPRGITGGEFDILRKEALPRPQLSPAANKARIKRFVDKGQKLVDKQQKLIQVQEQYGYVPENIRALVSKGEDMKADQAGFEKMPPASSVPPGRKVKDNETGKTFRSDGRAWQEVK